MTTAEKLDALTEKMAQRDLLVLKKAELMELIIPLEVKKEIEALGAEFDPNIAAAELDIETLTAEIKNEVKAAGTTIRGKYLRGTFVAGRTLWDNKILEGIATIFPQILAAKSTSATSARIDKI